ncbi:cryptochrome-1, partial [Eurytemora carolleeae]|uniref:cryptochrome-1 n=1 Tax=Eurytemora carolleeae TaxID=1294199 RepID=UPI000C770CDB
FNCSPVHLFTCSLVHLFIRDWDARLLTWEEDTEPYAVSRDAKIKNIAKDLNVEVKTFCGHTLYNPEAIIAANKGDVPLTYQKFQGLLSKLGSPAKPLELPAVLPTESKPEDIDESKYDVPSLEDILKRAGKKSDDLGLNKFPGGESEALKRLEDKICEKTRGWVLKFEKPNTSPNSLEPSTTVLSPYLKFGCLSPRTMYWQLQSIYKTGKHTEPPVSLHGQLLWREFFYTVGANTRNFDKMEGNQICKQIDWDSNPEKVAAWAEARTGFPWIDAIMTQLRTEGWIHHLARHSVACFLTRGDLYQSWERGQEVFEELLLDADWSLNAGNWMWLSASSFFYQFFRVYSPVAFGKKTDPTGEYIRKYLPQLKKYPDKYIYSPWEAPLAVQKAAGCIIGQDYPRPIVDHTVISKINIGRMKKAYDAGKAGKETPKKKEGKEPPKKKQKTMDGFLAKK